MLENDIFTHYTKIYPKIYPNFTKLLGLGIPIPLPIPKMFGYTHTHTHNLLITILVTPNYIAIVGIDS